MLGAGIAFGVVASGVVDGGGGRRLVAAPRQSGCTCRSRRRRVAAAAGLALLIACAVVAPSGVALWQFWAALVLLGLGWNFGFIGATAMVAGSYLPSEKGKAQGFHDLVLFGSVAMASLLSGVVFNAADWNALNWTVFPIALTALGTLALTSSRFQTI